MTDKTKKIIILDDEPIMLQSLKRKIMTEREEYDVKGFTSAQKALEELDNGECFAFITDIMMPDMTGDEVIEQIKERKPTQPCIVITGFASRDKISRIVNAGNTIDILSKPLVFDRLLKALDKIDDLRRQPVDDAEVPGENS